MIVGLPRAIDKSENVPPDDQIGGVKICDAVIGVPLRVCHAGEFGQAVVFQMMEVADCDSFRRKVSSSSSKMRALRALSSLGK